MKVLVSGSNGLVGSALVKSLEAQGHRVGRLVRHRADITRDEIYWSGEGGSVDASALRVFAPDAVVHLAGESIASGRWNEALKTKIRESRVKGTAILARALASLDQAPRVWINASAVGFYGDRGSEVLTEDSVPGQGFLAQVCQEWEAAAQAARDRGIRVVDLRLGMVLSPEGGALKKMLIPFRLGLGGVIGNGRQYMSWITLDEVVSVLNFALASEKLQGAVNAVSPQPVTNREFTKTLARVLWRPACLPMPASTARLVFGEMADALLLSSQRVLPKKLQAAGYGFTHGDLKSALVDLLKK